MRNFKDYFFIFLKGMGMGAADVVPGVSGGTIAFIAGIYEELVDSIAAIKPSLWDDFKKEGFASVWQKINGNFLIALLSGIAVSILSLAKILTHAMQFYPIQLWAFFFGLIIASIWYVGKQIKKWDFSVMAGIIIGTLAVLWLSITPPMGANSSYLFLFFAGAIAACAMILPGISGSFILLLLGAYATVISAVGNQDIVTVAVVGLGAVTGLLSFSKLLKFLLEKYHNSLIAVLTGFLIGSLWKIWPWKKDEIIYVKELGPTDASTILGDYNSLSAYLKNAGVEEFNKYKAFIETNIPPHHYESINSGASADILSAIIFSVFGFSVIFIIEYIAKLKNV